MGLSVWLPLNGDLHNQGLSNITMTNNGATVDNNGKIGKCYSFDGNDDFISISCSDLYYTFSGGSQPFSIAFWVYHADTTRAIIFGDYGLSGTIVFNIELTTGHQVRFYWNGTPDKVFSANSSVGINTWTHIIITYDGNEICIYKNGVQQSDKYSGTLAAKSKTSGVFYLGRDSRTGSTALNGKINDFRIYDHCLSPIECKQVSAALVLHYPLSMPGQENLVLNSINIGGSHLESGNEYMALNLGQSYMDITSGTQVTISFDLEIKYVTESSYFYIYNTNNKGPKQINGVNIGTQVFSGHTVGERIKKRVSATTTIINRSETPTITDNYIEFYTTYNTGNVFKISNLKIELGSVPTPWIPNSADPLYSSLGFNDGIEYDVSGYQHNGTKHGTITYDADTPRYETSAVFNGTNGFIEAEPLPIETKTISVWIKTPWASSSGYKIPVHDKVTGLAIGWSGNQLITYIGSGNGGAGSRIDTSGIWTANKWHHVVIVKTGDTTRNVYIDGVLISPVGANYWGGDLNKLNIGGRHISGSYNAFFNGQLADFRAYTTELSLDDILELYQTGASLSNNGTLLGYEYVEI